MKKMYAVGLLAVMLLMTFSVGVDARRVSPDRDDLDFSVATEYSFTPNHRYDAFSDYTVSQWEITDTHFMSCKPTERGVLRHWRNFDTWARLC